MNADGIVGANGGIAGYNLFAYCNNNPVIYYDHSGNNFTMAMQHAMEAARETYYSTSVFPQITIFATGTVLVAGVFISIFGGDIAEIANGIKAAQEKRAAKIAKKAAERALEAVKSQLKTIRRDHFIRMIINSKGILEILGGPFSIREAIDLTQYDLLACTYEFIPKVKNWGIYTPNRKRAKQYLIAAFGSAVYDINSLKHSAFPHYHIASHTFSHNNKDSNHMHGMVIFKR